MDTKSRKLSRRDFAKSAALVAAAVSVPADLVSQESTQAAKPPAPPPTPKLSADAMAEVDERYLSLLRKYGSRLTEEQKTDIHRMLINQQDGLNQIRAFPLENWDEPATVFHVVSKKGGKA